MSAKPTSGSMAAWEQHPPDTPGSLKDYLSTLCQKNLADPPSSLSCLEHVLVCVLSSDHHLSSSPYTPQTSPPSGTPEGSAWWKALLTLCRSWLGIGEWAPEPARQVPSSLYSLVFIVLVSTWFLLMLLPSLKIVLLLPPLPPMPFTCCRKSSWPLEQPQELHPWTASPLTTCTLSPSLPPNISQGGLLAPWRDSLGELELLSRLLKSNVLY